MKKIPLSRDKSALVDNEDYEQLVRHRWYCSADGYAVRKMQVSPRPNRRWKTIWMHRELVEPGQALEIDHINGNRIDNRKTNLRAISHMENMWNMTKAKGYTYERKLNKYKAQLLVNGKRINLGRFDTAEEARIKYVEAKKIHCKIRQGNEKMDKNKKRMGTKSSTQSSGLL